MYLSTNNREIANSFHSINPVSISSGQGNAASTFAAALGRLFNEANDIIRDYADPNKTTVEINGFGSIEKNSPSASLAISVAYNLLEAQLNTSMSGIEYLLKTFPQKLDSLFG